MKFREGCRVLCFFTLTLGMEGWGGKVGGREERKGEEGSIGGMDGMKCEEGKVGGKVGEGR